jgi:hypothetical protein
MKLICVYLLCIVGALGQDYGHVKCVVMVHNFQSNPHENHCKEYRIIKSNVALYEGNLTKAPCKYCHREHMWSLFHKQNPYHYLLDLKRTAPKSTNVDIYSRKAMTQNIFVERYPVGIMFAPEFLSQIT